MEKLFGEVFAAAYAANVHVDTDHSDHKEAMRRASEAAFMAATKFREFQNHEASLIDEKAEEYSALADLIPGTEVVISMNAPFHKGRRGWIHTSGAGNVAIHDYRDRSVIFVVAPEHVLRP